MDIQKTMEFILEHEAAITAKLASIADQQAASAAKQDVFETNIARLMEAQYNSEQRIARNEAAIEHNEAAIAFLIESQQKTDERLNRLAEGLGQLKANVDALVLVADSFIRKQPEA